MVVIETVVWCSLEKVLLNILQNSLENTSETSSIIKRETLAQVFYSDFCEIFIEHL